MMDLRSRLSEYGDYLFSFTLGIIVTVSLCGNLASAKIFYIRRGESKVSPVEALLLTLCGVNVLFSFTNGITVVAAWKHGWYLFGEYGCISHAAVSLFLALAHLSFLVAVAVIRYLQVCQPQMCKVTKTLSYRIMSVTFIFAGITSCVPIFLEMYEADSLGFSCSVGWNMAQKEDDWNWNTGKTLYVTTVCFVYIMLPAILILFCYTKIITKVSKCRKTLGNRSAVPDQAVTRMTIAIALTYLVSWGPYSVTSVYTAIFSTSLLPLELTPVPILLLKASPCVYPVICIFLNHSYQKELRRLLGMRESKRSPFPPHVRLIPLPTKDQVHTGGSLGTLRKYHSFIELRCNQSGDEIEMLGIGVGVGNKCNSSTVIDVTGINTISSEKYSYED